MPEDFKFDVFLSYGAKDKTVVRELAARLKKDGVRVWLDKEQIKPGDSIPAKIEAGLENSRVLVLCMSANSLGSDWAQLEAGTFRFRDPLNQERRFLPLRLDDAPIKGSLAQFLCINWKPAEREQEYLKLLDACRTPAGQSPIEAKVADKQRLETAVRLDYGRDVYAFAFSPDGKQGLSGSNDRTIRLWDVETGRCLRTFENAADSIWSIVWSADQLFALVGVGNEGVQLWDVQTGKRLLLLTVQGAQVCCVSLNDKQNRALSGSWDRTIRLWDLESGSLECEFKGHTGGVRSVAWSFNGRHALSGSDDSTLRLWDVKTGRCLRVLEGHALSIESLAWSVDGRHALSGSGDKTVRLWDVETGRCLRVLEGHTDKIWSLAWSVDGRHVLSGSNDATVRLWDIETGRCLRVLKGHRGALTCVAWSVKGDRAFSCDYAGGILEWDLSEFINEARAPKATVSFSPPAPDNVQYTNAKVLLVGESGAGKTGISKRLAIDKWEPSDSTVGAWATQWKLPVASASAKATEDKPGVVVEREIWLWDFGGQADQRLIHQLYMDETALAGWSLTGRKKTYSSLWASGTVI